MNESDRAMHCVYVRCSLALSESHKRFKAYNFDQTAKREEEWDIRT